MSSKNENCYMRTYAEIDLRAIRHNIMEVHKKLAKDLELAPLETAKTGNTNPSPKVLAVVKSDAYGHGVIEVVKALQDITDFFAVATYDEALEIRDAGLQVPVLILGYVSPSQYEKLIEEQVSITIYSLEDGIKLSEAAKKVGRSALVHIAVDTGMTRIGFLPNMESAQVVQRIFSLEGIKLEGMFTHFSCADMKDKAYAQKQWQRYDAFSRMIDDLGVEIEIRHICNSAAIMEFDHHRYDMVRSGITTYGLYPSDEVNMKALDLKAALSWKSHVTNLMNVAPGVGISYGATFVTEKPMRIATVSIGYADGYPRNLSNRGRVLIRGHYAPIVGRVCMDQMMVDVTDIADVEIEDVVTLVGKDQDQCITMEEIAGLGMTFNYEFACNINMKRVPRIYKR